MAYDANWTDTLNDLDIEQLVSFEGHNYHLSNGTSGLQLNVQNCPNCGDNNWKLYLNADTGLGNCFKCDFRYNRYKFLKASRGFTTHGDVVKYVNLIDSGLRYRPKVRTKTVVRLNKDWKFPLNKTIEKTEEIPAYLADRGIDLKIIKRFDLRFCEHGFYQYENLQGKNAAVDFSQRILIPIRDIEGKFTTFQGRDITGTSKKKYLFPNMLPATGAFIYNADYILKNNIKKVILNEGVFDVYATTQALESDVTFNEWAAAGTFGKHLSMAANGVETVDQLQDLFRLRENGLEELVILWDSEPKAILKAMETALQLEAYGFNCRVGILPNGCDPNETSKEEVLKAIKNAEKVSRIKLAIYRMKANEQRPPNEGVSKEDN